MQNTVVIFGASGDLTSRKLIPALYELFRKKRLPANTRVIGFSRSEFSHDEWRQRLTKTTAEFEKQEFQADVWNEFAKSIYYHAGDIGQPADFVALGKLMDELEGGQPSARVYYLATAPQFYEPAVAHLGQAGLADEAHGTRRIVIEKPFGTDLTTARRLNVDVHKVFAEQQVYRIDHYLGKETVQNILVLRFANAIFEPLWNRNYIDHVQITVAEEVTVGRRGPYYESAGVIRDMFQNHLLQLLMVVAMEPPVRFKADPVRDEKVKVLQAIAPLDPPAIARDTLRAQYQGYRQEPQVDPNSQVATYAAIKLNIENWRWHGVPFYLRSGKAMSCRTTQIVIQFRQPPFMLFQDNRHTEPETNRLILQVQPAEGIQLSFQTKVPDAGMKMRLTDFDFKFSREFAGTMPDSYQRLLLDVLSGDASLFARADEVELSWGIIDPILEAWQKTNKPELEIYEPGLWGPENAMHWMYEQGRQWFDTCPVLS